MDKYTIYCTEEQTRKALELGASIHKCVCIGHLPQEDAKKWHLCPQGKWDYHIPTAEQMIGWIEENSIILDIDIYLRTIKLWTFVISLSNGDKTIIGNEYNSRKETTLAAIDVALEYLANKNE